MPISTRPKVAPPVRRGPGKYALAVWAWISRICLAVLDRDVHDVRRAAAAPQNRHCEWRQKWGLLPLCPEIRGGIAKGRPVRRGARDGWLGGEPAAAGREGLRRGSRHCSERRGQPRGRAANRCPGQPVPRAVVGLLPRRTASRSPQSARGQTNRCRSAGQRYLTPSPCNCLPSMA